LFERKFSFWILIILEILNLDTCVNNNSLLYDTNNDQLCPEPIGAQITIAMYVIYTLFLWILLVNLLIALFRCVFLFKILNVQKFKLFF
jgi:hypothetical protein